MLPDYSYFNHSAHLDAGIGCSSCHGDVQNMEVVSQQEELSMSWCLTCHRNPDPHLRPRDQITNTHWRPPPDQDEFARRVRQEREINPPVDCSGCHR
jgi:hypothetical protein